MYGLQVGMPPAQTDLHQTFGRYWAYLQTRRDQLSRKMLYHWVVQNEWRTWLRLYLHFRRQVALAALRRPGPVDMHMATMFRLYPRLEMLFNEQLPPGATREDRNRDT
jgi:hypothetical protein